MPSPRPRVAVVEDYGPMRALLLRDLAGSGFQVDGYADAASLWRHFSLHRFDLVVLNIGLPDEDGFSVSRRLRRQTNIPVVLLSGYGSHEHQLLGLRDGADAYLVKPVETRVLVATLQRLSRRLEPGEPGSRYQRDWRLADQGWLLCAPDGADIALNGHERDLLRALAAAGGDGLDADRLGALLVRPGAAFERRLLGRMVWRLRRKIAAFTPLPPPLRESGGVWRFAGLIEGDHPPD